MPNGTLAYQARRHPFAVGVAALILGPYILAFALVIVLLFAVAAALDLFISRR